MEWKFVIHHFYANELYADSTVCYNAVYDTDKEALKYANVYAKENNLKGYLIRIYRRKRNSDDNWELYSRYNYEDGYKKHNYDEDTMNYLHGHCDGEVTKDYKVGDKVWFIKSFEEIYWRSGMFRPPTTKHPFEKKITQIVRVEDGILYQVKGGHFHSSWIGKIVFSAKEQAEIALKTQFDGGMK